jgi:hypothetical protein
MKTAGVVFDFYDDPSGELVKTAFPTPDDLPDFVKTAHILNPEEREVLRDEAYALVMSNEGKILRKFACVDAGNTLLSCLYFEENAQRLPEEAIKVAAANLASFCQDFGFEPTNFVKMANLGSNWKPPGTTGLGSFTKSMAPVGQSLSKLMPKMPKVGSVEKSANLAGMTFDPNNANIKSMQAQHGANWKSVLGKQRGIDPNNIQAKTAAAKGGQSRTRDSMHQPLVGDEADWAARTNLVSIRGGADSGRVIPTANQMKTAGLLNVYVVRQGETPQQINLDSHHKLNPEAKPPAKHKKKTAEVHGGGATLTDDKKDNGPKSKNPDMLKKSVIKDKNTFAVGQGQGDLEVNYKTLPKIATIVDVSNKVPVRVFEKRSSTRFALGNSYPLDSYADVSAAVQYFDDYWTTMNSADRHTYAVKTASRADELGIETSELLARYGSTEYAPDIDAHLASRKAAAPAYGGVYDAMREKRAEVSPDTFVELLKKVDEEAGLNWYYGGEVTDPYLATFGGKEKAASSEWSWEGPNGESLNAEQLQGLVGKEEFNSSFDKDITSEFAKDPIAIFDSMPAPTKAIMARLALEE